MDENTTTQVTEETTPDQADNGVETPKPEEKLFTQEELNAIVQKEKAKAKKGQPSKEEWAEFQKYKSDKQTAAEKHAETAKQLEAAQAEIAELKNRGSAMKSGCKSDFVDFIVHTVSKMDGEFAENLEEFKKANPQYFGSNENPNGGKSVKLGTSPSMRGTVTGMTKEEIVAITDPAKRQAAIKANLDLFR